MELGETKTIVTLDPPTPKGVWSFYVDADEKLTVQWIEISTAEPSPQ